MINIFHNKLKYHIFYKYNNSPIYYELNNLLTTDNHYKDQDTK